MDTDTPGGVMQRAQRDEARQGDDDRQHRREDGAVDEEA
jgi:hypothetical protein